MESVDLFGKKVGKPGCSSAVSGFSCASHHTIGNRGVSIVIDNCKTVQEKKRSNQGKNVSEFSHESK